MKRSIEVSVQVMDDMPVRNTATDTGCLVLICKDRVPYASVPAPRGTALYEGMSIALAFLRME